MKTFVVTGAGSGIGRATAKVLASHPSTRLLLVGRTATTLQETLDQLPNKEIHGFGVLDTRDALAWKKFYTDKKAGELNISGLFANAGTGGVNHYGEGDRWEEIISVNLTGTYVSIRETLPFLRQSKETFRNIVITSSCLARFGVTDYTAYCTSKTGLLGLTRSLALELASDNILVNAICPGWVQTEMARKGIQKLADKDNKSYEESFDEQMSFVPLNKISQAEEIGQLVYFLLSNQQTSITGQGLDINNGSFMI